MANSRLAARLDDVRRVSTPRPRAAERAVARPAIRERGFDKPRFVDRVGVDRDLHVVCRLRASGVDRGRRCSPSLQFEAIGAGTVCSDSAPASSNCLPMKPRFIGNASAASSIRCGCHGPGARRHERSGGRPGAPPSMVVMPDISVVDLLRADIVNIMIDAAGVTIMPPAVISCRRQSRCRRPAGCRDCGLAESNDLAVIAGRADGPPPMTSALLMPCRRSFARRWLWPMHRGSLCLRRLHFLAVYREIALDLDDEIGVSSRGRRRTNISAGHGDRSSSLSTSLTAFQHQFACPAAPSPRP